jgi:integrase
MACLYHEKKRDAWKVIYNDESKKRRALCLDKGTTKKQATWWCTLVEDLLHAQATGGTMGRELALRIGRVSEDMLAKLSALGLVEPPKPNEAMELGRVIVRFIELHDGEESTKTVIGRCRRHLVKHFGEKRRVDTITKTDADDWTDYLTDTAKLSKATKGRTIKTGKQIFKWAVKRDLIEESPFAELVGNKSVNPERIVFVDRTTVDRVIEHCPDAEWRLLIALSRYGGLRCPTEHLELKWSDINWERGVMTVRSPKTKRYPNGASRIVPLFRELRPYLAACFERPEADTVHVIGRYRRTNANLRTQLERYIARAGVKLWPQLFQNLRASRATELKSSLPAHTAAKIMGHSIEVAANHYWQMTDADIDAALNVATPETTPEEKKRPDVVIDVVMAAPTSADFSQHQGEQVTPKKQQNPGKSGLSRDTQKVGSGRPGTRTPTP